MLNMENAYGTKDTLNEIFERAKLVNEPLKVYRQLLKIFERSNKTKVMFLFFVSFCFS